LFLDSYFQRPSVFKLCIHQTETFGTFVQNMP
jgi:hypothetical protein